MCLFPVETDCCVMACGCVICSCVSESDAGANRIVLCVDRMQCPCGDAACRVPIPGCFGWRCRLRNPMPRGRLHSVVGWSIAWRSNSRTQRLVPPIHLPPLLSTLRAGRLSARAWRCSLLSSNANLREGLP